MDKARRISNVALLWLKRSLAYLCRSFDELYRGQDYQEAKLTN